MALAYDTSRGHVGGLPLEPDRAPMRCDRAALRIRAPAVRAASDIEVGEGVAGHRMPGGSHPRSAVSVCVVKDCNSFRGNCRALRKEDVGGAQRAIWSDHHTASASVCV